MTRSLSRTCTRARLTAAAMATTALTTLTSSPALGDVTIAEWNSSTDFAYNVNDMPDLDQRRVGLANQGGMHCVPTAAMNMLAYAAQWGFEDLEPGPGTWTGYDGYYDMTAFIDELGDLMGTTGEGGTGGTGWRQGLEAWIAGHPLCVDYTWRSGDNCPSLSDIVKSVEGGYIAEICFGRYEWEFGFQGIKRLLERTGGHAVTLKRAGVDDEGNEYLWTRDPADDNPVDVFGQSPFSSLVYDSVETHDDLLHDLDEDGVWTFLDGGTLLNFNNNPESRIRMIDSVMVMRPLQGYSFTHVEIAFPGLAGGGWITNLPGPNVLPLEGFDIQAAVPGMGFQTVWILISAPGAGTQLVPHFRTLDDFGAPVEMLAAATDIATGVSDDLFVVAGPVLERRSQADPTRRMAIMSLQCPADAVVFDDDDRRVICFSDECDALVIAHETLETPAQIVPLPSGVPQGVPNSFEICPKTGDLYATWDDTDIVHVLSFDSAGGLEYARIVDPALIKPTHVTCDDRGLVICTTETGILVFKADGTGGYERIDHPFYADVELEPGTIGFVVDRSRSNWNAREHDKPGWNTNIDASELADLGISIADCPGDVDGNGMIDFDDLLSVLAAWGTDSPLHDVAPLGGDGTVDFDDVLTVLAGWGDCN